VQLIIGIAASPILICASFMLQLDTFKQHNADIGQNCGWHGQWWMGTN